MADHPRIEKARQDCKTALEKLAKIFPSAVLPDPATLTASTFLDADPSVPPQPTSLVPARQPMKARRGDGRWFQRGNQWWIAYYVKKAGKSVEVRERAGRTEKEAQKKLAIRRKQVGAHDLGLQVFKGPQAERITIEALLDRLEYKYQEQGKERRRAHSHLKPLQAFFGVERAVCVTAGRMSDYIRARQHEQASNGTINRELRILRRAFNLGADEEHLNKSSVPKFDLLPEENIREGFVEKGAFDAILSHLKDADVRDVVAWAFWTGMRKGEIGKLTWKAYDKETWTLTLPGRITKNGRPRKLALEGSYREIIKRRLAARVIGCDFIFHRNGAPMGTFRKAWANACKKAGVVGLLFHDLRRTAVRNMVRAGVDKTVARTISGHRTEAVFERYNITDDADLKEAALKTEAYISALPVKSNLPGLEQFG